MLGFFKMKPHFLILIGFSFFIIVVLVTRAPVVMLLTGLPEEFIIKQNNLVAYQENETSSRYSNFFLNCLVGHFNFARLVLTHQASTE